MLPELVIHTTDRELRDVIIGDYCYQTWLFRKIVILYLSGKIQLIFNRESNIREYSCKYFEPTQITRGSLVSWDFAYSRIWKYSHAKSFWRRGELWRAATGGRPVYNKAQYPRISLSCIFNDFLGDFGRSSWWCEGRNREVGHKRGCTPREQRKIGIVKMNRAHIHWCLK